MCNRAWILTTDPPRNVNIEKGEDGNDDAEDGSDEIFDREDPGRC